jgi:predicted RNA-binding protein YlxR (DUF448 family)
VTASVTPCPQPHEHGAGRERRCIVSGEVVPDEQLIRFVADPEGRVVPDIGAKLPGRGMWVFADRASLEVAIAKNHFSRSARAALTVSRDLPALVETLLARRIADDLGLARRAGQLVQGFDGVGRAFDTKRPPDVLVEASDGSADGRRKIMAMAKAHGLEPAVVDCLNSLELSLALGRENVVHAALTPGRLSERVKLEAGRLRGFRPASGDSESLRIARPGSRPAPTKDTNERDE